jgi:hypothetical protein
MKSIRFALLTALALVSLSAFNAGAQTPPSRLRSKVLVILYEDTPANRAAIDAIRIAYKASTRDQSVLLATEHVDVSF